MNDEQTTKIMQEQFKAEGLEESIMQEKFKIEKLQNEND